MAQNLLKIENVKKAYRKYSLLGKETSTFTALNGLNLSVEKGQIYGFLGPNGAGKTTTIKCIIGINVSLYPLRLPKAPICIASGN